MTGFFIGDPILSRLVTDLKTSGATTYSYDGIGNLSGGTYPNGVRHGWSYDSLDRLTDLAVTDSGGVTLKGYHYTLGAAGNRTSATEPGGRAVTYQYDDLYRLTNEEVLTDSASVTGSVAYVYDVVGNRQTRTATATMASLVLDQNFAGQYDSNDRFLAGTGYGMDADGSTTTSPGGWVYTYDAENRLISATNSGAGITASYTYDGDGNRVSKTVNGVTTDYVVDTQNPTGYAQVLAEIQGGEVVKRYTYGHDLISMERKDGSNWIASYYGYDGTGSVRALTDSTGAVTDSYDYDAFGTLLNSTGSTPNEYLFHGERKDPETGLVYLRARYMDPAIGRFTTMDSFEGRNGEPKSLHKYQFVQNNPINQFDPSGLLTVKEGATGTYAFILRRILERMGSYEKVYIGLTGFSTEFDNGSASGVDKLKNKLLMGGVVNQAKTFSYSNLNQASSYMFGRATYMTAISKKISLIIVGHSLGGWAATKLAEQARDNIEVRGLFLIDPVINPSESLIESRESFDGKSIGVPTNVENAGLFYQRENWPFGWPYGYRHMAVAGTTNNLFEDEIHCGHAKIDDNDKVQRQIESNVRNLLR